MKPVTSVKNQYQGINAHLHSLWQAEGGWSRFHNLYIAQLTLALKAQLRPLGYTADAEQSLQIWRVLSGDETHPRADIMIRDPDKARSIESVGGYTGLMPEAVIPVADLIDLVDTEHPYFAVAIYDRSTRGQPIAWLELLSPSNKGSNRDAYLYQANRDDLLASGIVFVELDYLHETPSTFKKLIPYPDPFAHPYRLVVLDPRPDLQAGWAELHEFDVDVPIPHATLPLSQADRLDFDFDVVYQQVFASAFYGDEVDYAELPLSFERYSPADQQRIAARMLAVLQAAEQGLDLEQGALPTVEIELTEALAQIAALKNRA